MPDDNGAAAGFWLELRTLYLAAGQPTLRRLVHLGLEQRPPLTVSPSTVNDWLNGKTVPTGRKNEHYLTAMVAFLQARVRPEAEYQRLPPGGWVRLLHAAQRARAAGQRTGRPRRPAGPLRPPGSAPPASAPGPPVPPAGHPAGAGSPLVGRDRELARLDGLVRAVATGAGNTVLVEGEPGVGKSALVQAALACAADLGAQVFWGTGSELDEALPLQPLLDALRVREPAGDPRRETIAGYLRGDISADRGADGPALIGEQLLALVAGECAVRPVILVVDDLQWADHASIRLLARLSGLARQRPLLVVLIMRPVPRRDEVTALRRAAGPAVRLPLSGLPEAAVTELTGALAGGAPDARLLELARDAAGNPLYLTELMAALKRSSRVTVADGRAVLSVGPAPRSLTAAITDRLGFLSAPARETLRSASLLGPEFSVTDLTAVLGRGVADLAPVLAEACAAGVLAESGRALKFRHPLIHAALYGELPTSVRAAWHREAGHALAMAAAPADRVARQLLGATGEADGTADPLEEWMLSWLADAAGALVARAPQVAARLLTHAVASLPAGSDRRARLVSYLADSLYRTGERAAAAELAVRELARAADPDVRIGLHWTLAQCRMVEGSSAECLATLRRALGAASLPAGHRGRLLVLAARAHSISGELEAAARVARAALAAAQEAQDDWAAGWALHTMAITAESQGRAADALALFDRAVAVADGDSSLADLRLLSQINKAAALCNADRWDEALVMARQAGQAADRGGTVIRQAQAYSMLGQLLFETGRWDDARAELLRLPPSVKESAVACCELSIIALISFHRGDPDAGREYLSAVDPHAARIGRRLIAPLVLARSLEREQAGALPAALAALSCWLDGSSEEAWQAQEIILDAVRLAVLVGEPGTARSLAGQAAEAAAGRSTPTARGNALYCQGLVDGDASLLLAAAEEFRVAGRPLPRAQALEAASLAGDGQQARSALDGAVALYAALGARADSARARAAWQRA